MSSVLDKGRVKGLLWKLAQELGRRAASNYTQLFQLNTVKDLFSLAGEVENTSPISPSSEMTLRILIHDKLLKILESADKMVLDRGSVATLYDNIDSLAAVRDAIAEINGMANMGMFVKDDLTCLTSSIASWLSRRIELLEQVRQNRFTA